MSPELLLGQAMTRINGVYASEEDRKEAIRTARRELQELLRNFPGLGRGIYYLGVVELLLGRSPQALDYFKQVLAMHPTRDFASEIYLNIGLCYEDLGQREEAEASWILADAFAVKTDIKELAADNLRRLRQG